MKRKFKSLLSVFAAAMLCLTSTVTAFAAENGDVTAQIQKSMYEKFFYDIKTVEPDDIEITVVGTASNGTILFNYGVPDLMGLTVVTEETVGNFSYTYSATDADVKIFVNGEAYSLMNAYENSVVDDSFMDEAAAMIDGLVRISSCVTEPTAEVGSDNLIAANKPTGDADGDGAVSITDATLIQKYVSRIISEDEINCTAANVSGSGKLSVKDATIVQKMVAGLL